MPSGTLVKPYELIIPHGVWRRVLRELLARPAQIAIGQLTCNTHPFACELVAGEPEVTTAIPDAGRWPPLADRVLIACPTRHQSHDPHWWLERVAPRPAQLVAVSLLGMGEDRSGWDGIVANQGRRLPLTGLRIVGPRMLHCQRQAVEDDVLPLETAERWSRTRGAIGERTWRRLRQMQVVVVGAGRNGSALAWQLAALGVGHLRMIDPDRLELGNLDAMYGVTEQDVGRFKVEAVAEALGRFRGDDLTVSFLAASALDGKVVDAMRSCDVIVTCVDADAPRLAAAILANRFAKIHLDVGTGILPADGGGRRMAGDVRLLVPGQGCVVCVGGLNEEEQARYELLAPPGAMLRRSAADWQVQRLGSLISLNGIAVSAAVNLLIDLVQGDVQSSHWLRFEWSQGEIRADAGPVAGRDDCRVCGTDSFQPASR